MFTNLPPLAAKLLFVLQEGKVTATQIATACQVTVQAVNGWKKTGRIAKHHLPVLAEMSGYSLDWWLSGLRPQKVLKPAEWDDDTLRFATAYQALNAAERKRFEAFLLVSLDTMPDPEAKRAPPSAPEAKLASKK